MTEQDGDRSSSESSAELQAFAARFINLWQRQLEAMAKDPALLEMMAAFSDIMAPTPMASRDKDEYGTSDDDQNSGNTDPDGATAAAASSRQRGDEMDELARRVSACEKRLAALESGTEAGGGSTHKRPQKSKA